MQLNVTDKVPLHKVVPLDGPFVLSIEPSAICNLKCSYCAHSLPDHKKDEKNRRPKELMNFQVFDKIIHDLKEFNKPLKMVYLSQLGEPLLNNHLPQMVKRFHTEGVAEKTMLFTNAVPLTEEKSLALVEAGLTKIKIAVNGLSAEDYKKNCGVSIDFENFVKQIAFLYKNKKNLIIQIKTVDKLLRLGDDNRFYKIFGDICDYIDIEKLFPLYDGVPYDDLFFNGSKKPVSRFEIAQEDVKICALPFFRLVVAADGTINLCYSGMPDRNIKDCSLKEAWESERRKALLTSLLQQNYEGIYSACENCVCGHEQADENDNLYPYREAILQRLQK